MPRSLSVPWTLEVGETKPPETVLYGLGLSVAIYYALEFLTKYGVLMNRPTKLVPTVILTCVRFDLVSEVGILVEICIPLLDIICAADPPQFLYYYLQNTMKWVIVITLLSSLTLTSSLSLTRRFMLRELGAAMGSTCFGWCDV